MPGSINAAQTNVLQSEKVKMFKPKGNNVYTIV